MTRAPSTKSLFRAISGKSKRSAAAAPMFEDLPDQVRPAAPDARRDHDYYPTGQPEAIRALMAYDATASATNSCRQSGNPPAATAPW